MTRHQPDKAYALILVYTARITLPLVRFDEAGERGVTSMSFPVHALTRTVTEERRAWTTFKERYPVRIEETMLDDLPPFIRVQLEQQIGGLRHQPTDHSSVLARLSGAVHRLLLSFNHISECEGDLNDFREAIARAMERHRLTFIESSSTSQPLPDEARKRA